MLTLKCHHRLSVMQCVCECDGVESTHCEPHLINSMQYMSISPMSYAQNLQLGNTF